MKNSIRSLALGIALLGAIATVSKAATVSFNDSNNVSGDGSTFTFSQFNPTLGTLTAIDLIIDSSTLQGSFSLNRTSGTRTYTDFTAEISIEPATGFSGYTSSALSFNRSPSGNIIMSSGNPNQLVSVVGTTQSLISGSPVTLSINSPFTSYIGLSNVNFEAFLLFGDDNTGSGTTNPNTDNLLSPTTLTLRYTYTIDPVPDPEPGQVAASLLLLGGIGAYVFLKRRKKPAITTA
jgi:hypothetical protein